MCFCPTGLTACTAANPATPLLTDAPNTAVTAAGKTATGNVLDNASIPPGSMANVTGFAVAGSSTVYAPGTPVTVTDPTTGKTTGTLVVQPDGSYTFTPAGYTGSVPTINTNIRSSDGQTVTSGLTITVLPCEQSITVECPHPLFPCFLQPQHPHSLLISQSVKHEFLRTTRRLLHHLHSMLQHA